MDYGMSAGAIQITGADGDRIEAYTAMPTGAGRRGGVVLIHHMPGYDRWSKEVARRGREAARQLRLQEHNPAA